MSPRGGLGGMSYGRGPRRLSLLLDREMAEALDTVAELNAETPELTARRLLAIALGLAP